MLKAGDKYHLFTLTQPEGKSYWDRVCHAVSTDLLHWEDWENIILEEEENKDAWDAGVILTGSTFKCHQGYGMTYGAVKHGDSIQRIGLVFSKDLRRWEKYPGNPVLVPKGPYYEDDPKTTTENSVAWRDAYVISARGGYEAFIAANDVRKTRTVNGCIARVFSRDLVHWKLLPPIASPGRYVDMEVPQYFNLNRWHYLFFTTAGGIDTPSRTRSCGTYYLMANSKYGQYQIPKDNLLIGSGELRFDCYAGRVLSTKPEPLLYHHIPGERTAFAVPKVLRQDRKGRLYLQRWQGLDGLLGKKVLDISSSGNIINAYNNIPIGKWQIKRDFLVADAGPAISGWLFDRKMEDGAIKVRIDLRETERAGVLFRIAHLDQPRRGVRGLALCFNHKRGVIQLCEAEIELRRSVQLKPLDNVYLKRFTHWEVEIFLRAEYVEIYCNHAPYFALNASDYATSGKVGFFADCGTACFENPEVREITAPLK